MRVIAFQRNGSGDFILMCFAMYLLRGVSSHGLLEPPHFKVVLCPDATDMRFYFVYQNVQAEDLLGEAGFEV